MGTILKNMIILVLILLISSCQSESGFMELTGNYMGFQPPTATPELFARGVISTGLYERDMAITPDGNEMYFCVTIGNFAVSKIMMTKQINGKWTKPEIAPFSSNGSFRDTEPAISPDGKKFYFVSDRPHGRDEEKNFDIWVMDRTENGWGTPYNLGEPVNSEGNEFFPSLTNQGTIYFTRRVKGERADHIYRSRLEKGIYGQPVKLGANVNSGRAEFNAFIAPDESFLIVCVAGREDAVGSIDYYISFRDKNDNWSLPINLGDKINTPHWQEYSPYISPDGKYFFFMSTRKDMKRLEKEKQVKWSDIQNFAHQPENGQPDIYWVDASFIQIFQQKAEWGTAQ